MFSCRLSAKAVQYSKIQLPNGHHLHLFNTHLQASYQVAPEVNCDSSLVRMKQIEAMRNQILEWMRVEFSPDDVYLLVGDLNVDAFSQTKCDSTGLKEYDRMMKMFNSADHLFEDVLFSIHKKHIPTMKSLVTTENLIDERLDYCLQITPKLPQKSADGKQWKVHVDVNDFPIANKPYVQLSDHSALVITLSRDS